MIKVGSMTDSMKFGPEWLRNLAGDSCNSGGSGGGTANLITPRYQLAEHRYGREEMLALFDRNCKPPESIIGLQSLYVEKTQLPLAFIPETEDETRARSSGISSTAGRGRGGSVDRGGRIRSARGVTFSSHYSRGGGGGFDDSGDGSRLDSQSYPGRNRTFDRSQSERSWSERNGSLDTNDWNGSTSPRKELSRGTSGSSLMEGNWRRHRDDEEGWRTTNNRNEKWIRSNWRDGGGSDRDRLDRADGDGEDNRVSGRWESRGSHRSSHDSSHHHHPPRTARTWESNHHDNHDNLPEWATENPAESGGSFDASGAFHGGIFSDDDDDGTGSTHHEHRTRRVSEGTNSTHTIRNKSTHFHSNNHTNQILHRLSSSTASSAVNTLTNSSTTRERPKSLHPFESDNKPTVDNERSLSPPVKQLINITNKPLINDTQSLNSSVSSNKKGPNGLSNVTKTQQQQQSSSSSTTAATTTTNVTTTNLNSESNKIQLPQRSKSFVELSSKRSIFIESQRESTAAAAVQTTAQSVKQKQQETVLTHQQSNLNINSASNKISNNQATNQTSQKPDDDLERMKEEADMLVAKLMADEESHREENNRPVLPNVANHVQPSLANAPPQDKWYYRDPQGEVQGPFLASEMADWCKAGYFTPSLLVRRTCDERFATLGDLMKHYGRVPFVPGPPIPPLKLSEPVMPTITNTVPAGLTGSALPKPGIDDPLLLLQYQQLMMHNQQLLLRQLKTSAIAKLSQSEHWNNLSAVEQNRLIMQCVMQDPETRDLSMAAAAATTNPFVTPLAPPTTNPVMQLFNQMQQAKLQSENHLTSNPHSVASVHSAPALDPIQQLIQQMGGIQNLPVASSINPSSVPPPPSPAQPAQEEDPIKSLLRQLHVNANGHTQSHQVDSIWPQPPPPQINPQFNAQSWLAQVGPLPPMPPGQMTNSLWDLHTKEMKTEQQILEEQNIRIQENRKKELRKQEELKRQVEDESAKRKLEEDKARQLEEAQRKEEDRKRKEEEKRVKNEEKRKQEEEQKKKEEKKRKEEEKKREEKRKQDEENNRKKQEEEKKRREEAKKQEEKMRKEEEKRKKLEEEQKRLEEERLRKEEEAKKKAEAEEQTRRAEQRRREAEALKKLQERSKAPWAQPPHAPSSATHASLAEIQRLEREKKVEEQRLHQILQQQLAQQKAIEAAKEAIAADSLKRQPFKWAEKAAPSNSQPQVKSLAQIQQEEQERIAKVKQQEKERYEKAHQKEAAAVIQNAGIWGSASQSLNWTSTVNTSCDSSAKNGNNKAWTSSGFWDEPPVAVNKPVATTKQQTKVSTSNKNNAQPQQQQQQQQNNNNNNNNSNHNNNNNSNNNNNKTSKSKVKKEEELVKKLFENNTAKVDEFTQWCNRTLNGLQASVDIPTFVGFLRDIESAYEVKEYVRMYLGDSKQCTEFAKQFLEKRSKWRSAQRPQAEADDLCKPAPAVNPNNPTEFQEVKGKSKKPKKGKMFKVDNRILGFSVTAATDRINVGDRDYGEGV